MDTRKRILNEALSLFYEKGYDSVSVQEIVDAAGITKPTLYYYFGSKYGLLEALLEEGFTALKKLLETAVYSSENDVRNQLYKVSKTYMLYAVDNMKFSYFMLSLMYAARESEPYKAVRPYITDLYKMFIDMFANAGDSLGNMNGRQEQFAVGLVGLLNLHIYSISEKSYYKSGRELTAEDVTDKQVQALVQQFMYGIMS